MSQGLLQSIFEYQTMICQLTGMDVSNASVYDGASAAGEAAAMCRERGRRVTLVSETAHPDVVATVRTYCAAANEPFALIPQKDGVTDTEALRALLGQDTASVYIQQPNFYGALEKVEELEAAVHEAGAKLILGVNPIAQAILKSAGECGADIAVGEGQPLGLPLAFGGPYLGFMATKKAMMRKLPGRIVGQTTDNRGNRAYVLTLQAREQHIRREKASSNICSNEALCALTAGAYLAAMGPRGLAEAAKQCWDKAHYLCAALTAIPGVDRVGTGEFFHEFVTACPAQPKAILDALAEHDILGGLPTVGGILWCVTECVSRRELDEAAAVVREVCAK
ncbi:MAG: aminomethyl-transferring glycine dehydrogenase subunit GcvPA [Eubacteriales bacterium]|nr:aminomethyl-transferring glycine dehydrogenase subunit GcvPA [Eubacteriales bacterium]